MFDFRGIVTKIIEYSFQSQEPKSAIKIKPPNRHRFKVLNVGLVVPIRSV